MRNHFVELLRNEAERGWRTPVSVSVALMLAAADEIERLSTTNRGTA